MSGDRGIPPPPLGALHARRQRAGAREGQDAPGRRADPRPRGRRRARRQGRGARERLRRSAHPASTAPRADDPGQRPRHRSGTTTTSRPPRAAGPDAVVVPKVELGRRGARARRGAGGGRRARRTPRSGPWSRRRGAVLHCRGDRRGLRAARRAGAWAPTTSPRSCAPSTCPAARRCSTGAVAGAARPPALPAR